MTTAQRTPLVPRLAVSILFAATPALLADGHSVSDPEEVEIRMPGPWGDYSEAMEDPDAVDADAAYVGHRRHRMQLLSGYYRSLEMALRYDAPVDPETIARLAEGLERHAQDIPALFDRETPTGEDEPGALARIWEEQEQFQEHVDNFAAQTRDLQRAMPQSPADENDAWEPRATEVLNGVRHQCLACHDTFRRR
ncbi:cytochrome c [Aquisalimonas sp.]|uniref:cytochrome c n=1 Tax=unclassified Aquisalimonas TaxID=2644645 RepID=UPI0025C6D92B|nr:cytochrome c [Aquisalimonas sp.]